MPKKLEDCVSDVKGQGHSESSAYAICVASTGLSPHKESIKMITPDIQKTEHEDQLPGGLADDKEPKDFDKKKLKVGQKVETEHTSDKTVAKEIAMDHLTEDEEYYKKLKTIEKSTAIPSKLLGGASVDLTEHILSKNDELAVPMGSLLRLSLQNQPTQKDEISHAVWNFPIETSSGKYSFEAFQKEPNLYSGAIKALGGESVVEFNNQPIEIIASVLHTKIGNPLNSSLPLESQPSILSPMDEIVEIPIFDERDSSPESIKEEVRHRINANGIDSLLNTSDHELTNKLLDDSKEESSKIKNEIRITNDQIIITLFKSKENDMGLGDELKKAFGKKDDAQKPAAKKPAAKPALEDDDSDNVLSEEVEKQKASGDDEQVPPASIKPDQGDELNNSSDEQNRKNVPMGGDDQNSLPGSNLGGNTGGIQSQEGAQGLQGDEEGMDQVGLNGMPIDNHEYIKMTQHAAGKQYWYRDPMTGQIIEKPNAPDGHPDFDHSSVLTELISKVEEMSQQLQQLLGQEGDLDNDGIMNKDENGEDMINPENPNLEQAEEDTGMDLDGDQEIGESPEHQEKVLGGDKGGGQKAPPQKPQGQKQAPSPGGDKKPAAKPKPDFDKMKKSLKDKFPTISDEKLEEVLKKAMVPANEAHGVTESQSDMGPTEGDIGKVAESKGDSDDGNTKKKPIKPLEEKDNSGEVGGEPANKQGNAFEKIRKSKFDRMWKVFKIEMPDTLVKSEDFSKANDGLKKLQKCIMRQGKTESEANKIVNRAVIEKYDLLGEGKHYFNKSEYTGGKNFNTETESPSLDDMQQLRKSDADARFGIKEYTSQEEVLVIQKSSDINDQIKTIMNPLSPNWDYKDFQGDKIQKSQPTKHQIDLQKSQDARWNVPVWKGSEGDIKNMVLAKSQSINERIQSNDLVKSQNVTFDGKYKPYDESKVKLEKSQKTDSELMQEAIIKKNWKE